MEPRIPGNTRFGRGANRLVATLAILLAIAPRTVLANAMENYYNGLVAAPDAGPYTNWREGPNGLQIVIGRIDSNTGMVSEYNLYNATSGLAEGGQSTNMTPSELDSHLGLVSSNGVFGNLVGGLLCAYILCGGGSGISTDPR